MELKRIIELIDLLAASPLAELEVLDQEGWLKLVRPRESAPSPTATARPMAAEMPTPSPANVISDDHLRSPIAGVFYRAPAPDQPPFVSQGSAVSAGQTLALIEAMKTLCKVEAEKAGTVRRILVDNGTAVEEGQGLFEIT